MLDKTDIWEALLYLESDHKEAVEILHEDEENIQEEIIKLKLIPLYFFL